MTRGQDGGFILINVLVVLGLATTIVYAMLALSDLSLARIQRFSEAGQGLALVRGAEQSAIALLRRDMIEAPEFDYPTEPWSAVGQKSIGIPGGSYSMQIEDAQALLNLNALEVGGPETTPVLEAILAAVGLPPDIAPRLLASVEADGPLLRMADLERRIGLTPEEIAVLGEMVTALPGAGDVNINSAPQPLLDVLLNDPAQVAILIGRRTSVGFLSPDDMDAIGVTLPPGVGFQSEFFRLRITVRLGDTTQSVESLVQRREGPYGPEAAVIARHGPAVPATAPPPTF